MLQWKLENDVDDYIKAIFENLGLVKNADYFEKTASPYMQEALKGASKTGKGGKAAIDFVVEKYGDIPVVIENKLGIKKLQTLESPTIIKEDTPSVRDFALNGALHYAKHLVKANAYKEVIAVGVAGDSASSVEIKIFYVAENNTYIDTGYKDLGFLRDKESFDEFYENIKLTDEQKHNFAIYKRGLISTHAKNLSKIMNDFSILPHERALFVAACLLAMQDIKNGEQTLEKGLTPDLLLGADGAYRDSIKIQNHIEKFLQNHDLTQDKISLMTNSFHRMTINANRDTPRILHKQLEKSKYLKSKTASTNKQVFTYIYEHIFNEINTLNKNTKFYDIMGEMYNEFLKYAMSGGKEIGIVLTPFYVTKMMSKILEIDKDCKVLDLATGSAGFLIATMDLMISLATQDAKTQSFNLKDKIKSIKQTQLLGIEESADIYALATTNMILRGDGSSQIIQNDSFNTALTQTIKDFKADRILLNPPFSYKENGMPFIKLGLDNMPRHALGAIIIQDSAGSGKASVTNKAILQKHTLKASIKMPVDLFQPMAGVQTSIYVFEAGVPHDFNKSVKFIDFRNDGYKRTERALQEVDNPTARYNDIVEIYKNGKVSSRFLQSVWNLDEIYIEDFINDSGADWNFDQHKKVDSKPTLQDFKKCVSEYLAWEVSNVLKKEGQSSGEFLSPRLAKLENEFKQNGGKWEEFKLIDLFNYVRGTRLVKSERIKGNLPLLTAGEFNQGVKEFISNESQQIFNNAITIDMFCNSFVHIENFCCDDNILVLNAKEPMNKYHLRFISTIINKDKSKYGYGKQYRIGSLENHKVLLPTIEGKIAFEFMEQWIRELEVERIRELEAYLRVTGLKDYQLNDKEKQALQDFERLNSADGGGGIKKVA